MMHKKNKKGIVVAIIICIFLTGIVHTLSAQPNSGLSTKGTHTLLYLSADPPADTKSVRFLIDEMQVSELTNLYAQKTNTVPVWKTVIDPQWLDKGEHILRIEATTANGIKTLETKKIEGTKQNTSNRVSLTGEWKFAEMSELPAGALEENLAITVRPGYNKGHWTKVFVPNSIGAVSDKWNKYEGILGMYRKQVNIDRKKDEQVAILLESCYWSGRVFINGKEVGETHGGYLPSRFDITNDVKTGKNEIAVLVDNRFTTMGNFKRLNEFYWNWGGIVQEVYIEKNPAVAFINLRAEGAMDGSLKLHVTGLNNTGISQNKNISIEVLNANNKKVFGPVNLDVTIAPGQTILHLNKLQVDNPTLWDLDNPYLYTVVVKGNIETLKERTGFREVKVAGMDILLNGKPLHNLQGFNRHADYPGLGRTQPAGLVYEELKMLHDKGFRFFRPAHYPTTPAMLEAADEIGLLVIEEINVTGLRGAVMATKEVKDFGVQQLTKMINRDRSHPSIIAWSVGNENFTDEKGATDYISHVISTGRSIDPDRLYTQVTHRHTNDKTFQYQDFVAQNYYAGWYAKDINAIVTLFDAIQSYAGNKPVMLSEYGAEAIPEKQGTTKSTEFYQGFVVDAHNRLLNNRKHFFGKMYWCSTDFWCRPNWTGGSPEPAPPFHYKSLISLDREHKKLGWRVMFSPVRIVLNPHTVKANDLGGDIAFPVDKDTTIKQVITVKELKGNPVKGTMLLELPKGFTSEMMEYPFELQPEQGQSFTITITGKIISPATSAECFLKVIIDADTEAQPLLLTLKPKS